MNGLGILLAWAAVQVSLVLVPAAVLHVLASRRSAASGSWMAVVGLALSVAVSVSTLVPRPQAARGGARERLTTTVPQPASSPPDGSVQEARRQRVRLSLEFAEFDAVWKRLEQRVVATEAPLRRWGGALAIAGILGAGVGLGRLLLGLWAVGLCRRQGRIVGDADLLAQLDEIRVAMGSRSAHRVEVRELEDLTTPATAGWRRPLILLPSDWRSWREAERRVVLAHELAHIVRSDYATGIVARLALAVNAFHPLVHWMAARLALQQELAADALGARFSGGRERYLRTLARLALKQDARSSCWPLRAFLPARGTLIRRIAMLQLQDDSYTLDQPWSRPGRLLAGLGLLGLAIVVATLRGPAWGAEGDARPVTAGQSAQDVATPFDLQYMSEGSHGLIAVRPAASSRHPGMMPLARLIEEKLIPQLATYCQVDLTGPDRLSLRLEDIEWMTGTLDWDRQGKDDQGKATYRMKLGAPITVRTTRPFDWLKFLRGWRCEFETLRDGDRVYYKFIGDAVRSLGGDGCLYLPDERTAVFAGDKAIRVLSRRPKPFTPVYLKGTDWDRVSRGLVALAIQNRDGGFARTFDLGRPDEALFLSLFQGVDHWVLGVDDTESLVLQAAAACPGGGGETIARVAESLLKMGREALERETPELQGDRYWNRMLPMLNKLAASFRVGHNPHSVELRAEGFATLTEVGAMIEAELQGEEDLP